MTNDSSTNLEQPDSPQRRSHWLRHPIASLIVAAICVLLGWLGNWWFSSSVQPVYRVFPTEIVARRESPRLTVEWDLRRIENLCVSKVAMWNVGKTPLSQNMLPSSDPLRIEPSKEIRFLSVEQSNSSRPTLRVGTQLSYPGSVQVEIKDGDAIEKGEGVALRLLFTGDCSSDFVVKGRVIGASEGFKLQRESSNSIMANVFWGIAVLVVVNLFMRFARSVADRLVLISNLSSWAKHSAVLTMTLSVGLALALWLYQVLATTNPTWLP